MPRRPGGSPHLPVECGEVAPQPTGHGEVKAIRSTYHEVQAPQPRFRRAEVGGGQFDPTDHPGDPVVEFAVSASPVLYCHDPEADLTRDDSREFDRNEIAHDEGVVFGNPTSRFRVDVPHKQRQDCAGVQNENQKPSSRIWRTSSAPLSGEVVSIRLSAISSQSARVILRGSGRIGANTTTG